MTAVVDGLFSRRALVVDHPLLRHVGRVIGAGRVEGVDRRMVKVVCGRVGRVDVALRADDLHREILWHPDAAGLVVALDPIGVVAGALSLGEAKVGHLALDPRLDLVEPRTAGVAPAAVDIGDVVQSLLTAELGIHDVVESAEASSSPESLLRRQRLAGRLRSSTRRQASQATPRSARTFWCRTCASFPLDWLGPDPQDRSLVFTVASGSPLRPVLDSHATDSVTGLRRVIRLLMLQRTCPCAPHRMDCPIRPWTPRRWIPRDQQGPSVTNRMACGTVCNTQMHVDCDRSDSRVLHAGGRPRAYGVSQSYP